VSNETIEKYQPLSLQPVARLYLLKRTNSCIAWCALIKLCLMYYYVLSLAGSQLQTCSYFQLSVQEDWDITKLLYRCFGVVSVALSVLMYFWSCFEMCLFRLTKILVIFCRLLCGCWITHSHTSCCVVFYTSCSLLFCIYTLSCFYNRWRCKIFTPRCIYWHVFINGTVYC
jgi:hypothetical protein